MEVKSTRMRTLCHRKNRERMCSGSLCMHVYMYVHVEVHVCTCTHLVCTFMYGTSIHAACSPYLEPVRERGSILLDPKGPP